MRNISIIKLDENNDIRESQITKCIDIYNQSMSDSFANHIFANREDWTEIIEEATVNWNSCNLLSTDNKELIGFALSVGNYSANIGLLQLFAIDTNYQGEGLGRGLLEYCLDEMDNLGFINKITFAKKEMDKTLKFYQKIWGKIDFNNHLTDEYGDSIVKINFNKRPKKNNWQHFRSSM